MIYFTNKEIRRFYFKGVKKKATTVLLRIVHFLYVKTKKTYHWNI